MTSDRELGFTPTHRLREMIGSKEISPVELTESHLRRADELDPQLGIFITRISDQAVDVAREAEAAVMRGDELGPLHGIPVPVKDTEAMAGVIWTHGSLPHKDSVAEADSIPVARIRAAGAVITGKTNTPENGFAGTTENRLGPPARNPWDPERTPGGSSGGSAAAVAAGLSSYAPGGDGGGSIRIPAAFSGVYGIKATQGRVVRAAVGRSGHSIMNNATSGPLARTVRDAAVALAVGSGYHPDGQYDTLTDAVPDYLGALKRGVKGLKIGWTPDMGGNPVDLEVVRVAENAAKAFEELGATVETVDFNPSSYEEVFWTFFDYFTIKGLHEARHDWTHNRDQLTDYFGEYMDRANTLSADRMWQLLGNIGWYRKYVNEFFRDYDLLLSPTLACPAFKIGEEPEVIGGMRVPHRLWGFTPFTYLFNLTGNPAASAPAGFSSSGLPIGLHIIGGMKDEVTVLAASAALEEARPWADRHPPVS
ncbi:MAG: amidase [Dehalococcoidia bacterium]|jgi:aspartyl-tRNA(Asn)/glutamyl-tRNA(Gln) amidotransferase subunit A|nr:amidase [Dehalococcoidia bacterium]